MPSPPPFSARRHGDTLVLFDVDGTLAVAGQLATSEMVDMLARLREHYAVGIVGAAEFEKQQRQLLTGDLKTQFDFVFSENGVHAFENGKQIHLQSTEGKLGPKNFAFFEAELAKTMETFKDEAAQLLNKAAPGLTLDGRGTFLQKRQCTMNITPIGRTPTMTKDERGRYDKEDRAVSFRKRFVEQLSKTCGAGTECNLQFAISGQVGIDLGPVGWDKTFCLQFVDASKFKTVHFFGDMVHEGGGDHELYEHKRTIGHEVKDAEDTMKQLQIFFSKLPADQSSHKGAATKTVGVGRMVVKTLRILAALSVVGTFVLPVDWIELRLAVLGKTKFSWVAAMVEIQKPHYGAQELFMWFMLIMVGFILGSIACAAGHPTKAAVWNVCLLFGMADDSVLKPFPGVKVWFVLGYDLCWVATLVMLFTGLLDCCCPAPNADVGVLAPKAQCADNAKANKKKD
jgi:phosphomannomutase